ncbi:DUF559 domain-containing protein [Actibacterium sp. 188UL27-1]|nr:DUF559 domain-containing protein [Actibacterium sp. 188UL27-1]
MTPAQQALWQHLRAHRFQGLSIRRMAPIGPHIVDFLIPSQHLAVVINHSPDRDAAVQTYLAQRGYLTMVVSERDVLIAPSRVLADLAGRLT